MSYDERERIRKAEYAVRRRDAHANIGPPPKIKAKYKRLREACRTNLEKWHKEVFPGSTGLKPFGKVQKDSIKISADVIQEGGKVQKLEPRGYGKTTRTIQEALWALLYDYRRYVVIVASAKDKADELIEGIKLELETNEILFAMFPEVIFPIRELGGKAIKAKTQHIDGTPTSITWKKSKIVLPTVADSIVGGSVIEVRPIKNARGVQHRTTKVLDNGKKQTTTIRPDLYLLDDIQTDEVAANPNLVVKWLRYIRKGILRGGNLSESIAVIHMATVIEPDDVPEQLAKDDEWLTIRYKMLESPPTNLEWWFKDYAKILRNYRTVPDDAIATKKNKDEALRKATRFYRKHRKKADAGARVSWKWSYPWRDKRKLTISAIQNAMNIWIANEEVFFCECQNAPIKVEMQSTELSKATKKELVSSILKGVDRGIIPIDMPRIVAYVDTHQSIFYWVIVAKNLDTNRKHVVDYFAWPEQRTARFTVEKPTGKTISQLFSGSKKAQVKKAVTRVIDLLVEMRFKDKAGMARTIDEIRIDANWGIMSTSIKEAISNHQNTAMVKACHGIGIPASKAEMNSWKSKSGETKGDGFIDKKEDGVNTKLIDTNQWKSETHISITTDNEENGSLTIFNESPEFHDHFFDHILCEAVERVFKQRDCEEWTCPKNGQNHWFDCLVGAIVDDSKVQETKPSGSRISLDSIKGYWGR